MLGREGDVILSNQAARRLFCKEFQTRQKRLTIGDARAHRTLQAAIISVCSCEPGSDRVVPVAIPRQGSPPIVAFVLAARGVAADASSPIQAFMILVDLRDRHVPPPELLQKLFPLTATEARLSYSLAKGHKLHDLAASGGFSYETGRNHLKSVFAKLQVSSQSDLVALLVSLAVTVGIY